MNRGWYSSGHGPVCTEYLRSPVLESGSIQIEPHGIPSPPRMMGALPDAEVVHWPPVALTVQLSTPPVVFQTIQGSFGMSLPGRKWKKVESISNRAVAT